MGVTKRILGYAFLIELYLLLSKSLPRTIAVQREPAEYSFEQNLSPTGDIGGHFVDDVNRMRHGFDKSTVKLIGCMVQH